MRAGVYLYDKDIITPWSWFGGLMAANCRIYL